MQQTNSNNSSGTVPSFIYSFQTSEIELRLISYSVSKKAVRILSLIGGFILGIVAMWIILDTDNTVSTVAVMVGYISFGHGHFRQVISNCFERRNDGSLQNTDTLCVLDALRQGAGIVASLGAGNIFEKFLVALQERHQEIMAGRLPTSG